MNELRRRCETCKRTIRLRDDGTFTIHAAVGGGYCTGSDTRPGEGRQVTIPEGDFEPDPRD